MKKYIIIFFLLIGCSTNQNDFVNNKFDNKFSDNLTFEEFRIKLKVYANNTAYPNIDN